MHIQTAKVLGGSETPTEDGITGAKRCILLLGDNSKRAAIIKRGPIGQIAAEAFSALLLREWGLCVPEPFVVVEEAGIAFASADMGYPNLMQPLAIGGMPKGPARDKALQMAMTIACRLRSATLAAACDEAIDNRDRNLGNILWDGNTEAWIDHAFALGQSEHEDMNKLCMMATLIGEDERVLRGAIAHSLNLQREIPQIAQTALTQSPVPPQELA